jgi:hypothetical protein
MFQYLSWVNKATPNMWQGNRLLSKEQLGNVKAALLKPNIEVHESVQRYDKDGNVIYTYLYADFDGPTADSDTLEYVRLIESEFNIAPDIYFSGRKGYHVLINYKVYSSHPHLIAKEFALLFTKKAKSLDLQVYSSRHNLRSEGSIHLKSGLYKTRITKEMIGDMDAIKKVATKLNITLPTIHESRLLNLFIPTIVVKVDSEKREQDEKYNSVIRANDGELAPCIKALLVNQPVPGLNNNILTLIGRNMNSIGWSLEDSIAHVLSHANWSAHSRDVRSKFISIWKRPSQFGCKKESILKDYCDPFCHFNTEMVGV